MKLQFVSIYILLCNMHCLHTPMSVTVPYSISQRSHNLPVLSSSVKDKGFLSLTHRRCHPLGIFTSTVSIMRIMDVTAHGSSSQSFHHRYHCHFYSRICHFCHFCHLCHFYSRIWIQPLPPPPHSV